jgi:ketosteroid isomerase-like protein
MSADNVAFVRRAYEAMRMRQLQTIVQLAASDLEIEQSSELPWGGRYHGLAGLRQFMVRLTHHVDSVMTPDEYIDAGDQIVAVGRTRGTARETGASFEVAAVHVWTIRDGKLARFQAYIDHPAMNSALEIKDVAGDPSPAAIA